MIDLTDETNAMPAALLIGVDIGNTENFERSMDEMERLIVACDMEPVGRVVQNMPNPNSATYVGSGKVAEIALMAQGLKAQYVIFEENLSPAQLKNLQREIDAIVMDRTALILEIFSKRAQSKEARLQVELAHLQYMLPRLVGLRSQLGRQGGASGAMSNKGSGEKQIELDRRRIEKRISELRRELRTIEENRVIQRTARHRSNIPRVALVGYTNAGKSTMMNTLISRSGGTKEKMVFEKDLLFATLDTTVRRIETGDRKDFLLSDTVGFVSNLPHDLVQAFHSTLEEVRDADLLLVVIDASDEKWKEEKAVTEETLREIGAKDIPKLYVMNKADRVYPLGTLPKVLMDTETRIYLSAKEDVGVDRLLELVKERIYETNKLCKLKIPYTEGALLGEINAKARIVSREYLEDGIYIEADCPIALAGKIEKWLQD